MNREDLISFEKDIAELYGQALIKGPIHLRDGNENELIEIFSRIGADDYVFSTWANHLHALLKGIPADKVKARILESQSMAMNFDDYKFYTSAIVSGISPIAIGTALSIKRNNDSNRVWCFLGDMSFRTGISHESIMYAISHDLPITFVVENNNKSVDTPTQDVWGSVKILDLLSFYGSLIADAGTSTQIMYYEYSSEYPHSGTGVFVSF